MRRAACAAIAAAVALWSLAARAEETSPTARGGAVDVRAVPDQLTLGEDGAADVEVLLPKGARRVRLKAAVGKIKNVAIDEGRATGTYYPPDSFLPRVDVVLALVESFDGTKVGFAAIRLVGQGEAVLKTRPKAQARIRIGETEYGPALADKHGQARIQILVPPGTSVGYDESGGAVDLGVPPTPRVAVFPERAKGAAAIPVYVVATRRDGGPDAAPSVTLRADRGEISAPRPLGGGLLVATYTPPAGEGGKAVITAAVEGEDLPGATAAVKLAAAVKEAKEPGQAAAANPGGAPPGHPQVDVGLLCGYATNLGALNTFDVSAQFGYEPLFTRVALRLGARVGFSASRADASASAGAGATVDTAATLWLVPIVGQLGARVPLAAAWSLSARLEAGAAMLDNAIRVDTEGAAARSTRVRDWLPAFGGAAEIGYRIGPGQLVADLRYLQLFGAPESIDGRLGMLYVDLGYRLLFAP